MRKAFFILMLSLLPWPGQAEEPATRGIAVVPLSEVEPGRFNDLKQQSYGVFVGVNEFEDPGIQGLQFPSADARAMRDCFVQELGFLTEENTRLLTSGSDADQAPTRANVMRAIKWASTSAGPNGCVVVQISTHGIEGYLLTEESTRDLMKETAVPLSWVEETLKESRSNKRILIFDACREKWGKDGSKAIGGGMSPSFAEAFSKAEGFVALKSCSAGQYSYEMEEAGHGAFTHFLLEGLRGGAPPDADGFVTVTKLAEWVKDQVESWSRPRPGGVQSPMFSIMDAAGDLPLAMSRLYLDDEAQQEREERHRRLAQMFADQKLSRDQLKLAQAALDSVAPGNIKVVVDLLDGKISGDYLPQLLPGDSSSNPETMVVPPSIRPTSRPNTVPDQLTNSVQMDLKLVPAGNFAMGSEYPEDNAPVREAVIGKPFYIGVYEVTQGQWQSIMGNNPSHFTGDANRPVEQVTWEACQDFLRKLSEKDGATYRLPTEAEWEYACRAGAEGTLFSFGDDESKLGDSAWFIDNSNLQSHPVGLKLPNAWGLFDMHGNVMEWCEDEWTGEFSKPQGSGRSSGSTRAHVLRGGSWFNSPGNLRNARRTGFASNDASDFLGLRVVREP